MKYLMKHALKPVLLSVVCILAISSGCSTPNNEGFAIYLTEGDISPWEMPSSLSRIGIPDEPLVGIDDIITYDAEIHRITLSENATNKISALNVPTSGKSFVVCVNRKPVYRGTFWAMISSAIPPENCVIVSYPLSHTVRMSGAEMFKISPDILELSYYSGNNDPRNNPDILESLEQGGKLATNP